MKTLLRDINTNIFLRLKYFICLLILVCGFSFAQSITEGTELILTNATQEVILGHGLVHNNTLSINLSQGIEQFVMLFIHPDSDVEVFEGQVAGDGSLRFTSNGEVVDLAVLLSQHSISFDPTQLRSNPFQNNESRDDSVLETPNQ